MPQTLKKQALTLTIANGFTRGLGFLFRLMNRYGVNVLTKLFRNLLLN